MTDDFERRLERLALTPTGAGPSIPELQQRWARQVRRRIQIGTASVLVLVLLALLASFALASVAPSKVVTVTAVPAPTTTAPPSTDIERGDVPISGPGGRIVGSVDAADWAAATATGPPVLDIGTGAVEVRGFEVRDRSGKLVGYFLPGDIGFLTTDQAADAEAVDARVRADAPLSQAEAKALLEKLQEQNGSGGD